MAPMAVGASPAVARHRLRRVLRETREAMGLTQRQVAKVLEWSMSKINRIEAGEVTVSSTDLQALLRLLEITEPDQVDDLMEQARASRRHGWWDEPRYREHLTPAMIQLVQFELEATTIRSFQPKVIPGPLQTQAYAAAILSNSWAERLPEDDLAVRLEVRLRRRENLVSRPDAPECLVVLDESVLLREVGGAQVLADQLYDLLELARAGRVTVRVLPFAHAGGYAAFDQFSIYQGDDEDVALVYRELYEQDEALVAPESVHRHRQLFEQAWEQAASVDVSAHLIEASAAAKRLAADRLREQDTHLGVAPGG